MGPTRNGRSPRDATLQAAVPRLSSSEDGENLLKMAESFHRYSQTTSCCWWRRTSAGGAVVPHGGSAARSCPARVTAEGRTVSLKLDRASGLLVSSGYEARSLSGRRRRSICWTARS